MGNEALAHSLVAFPLLKGVAGAVPVLVKGEGTIREALLHKILDDGFLVFDGDVIPVQFIVHRDTAVARNVKAFGHRYIAPLSDGFGCHGIACFPFYRHHFCYLQIILYT